MGGLEEQELLEQALAMLRNLLGDDDGMEVRPHSPVGSGTGREAVWQVSAPSYSADLLVEAFGRFRPRDVDRVLGGVSPLVRQVMRNPTIVVVAPWLSPRTREMLVAHDLNYIDLTGNVRLKVARPAIRLRLDGAQQDPNPPAKPPVRLHGAGINALVRVLVEVKPPYRMVDLARATGLSNAYVSRALESLYDERLIDRSPQKVVTDVDWMGLLRARVEHYSLLKTNRAQGYVARVGASALYRRLSNVQEHAPVTGSFAVTEFVQVAVPTQLLLYVPDMGEFADRYELMPAGQGANVILLRAADRSQVDPARQVGSGAFHVGISQLALDCLAGNGRLPEEGEALVEWMADNVAAWRLSELPVRQ